MENTEALDYYQIESLLTEEERHSRNKARSFVNEECMPIISDYFDKGSFPMGLLSRMAGEGWFGLHVQGSVARRRVTRFTD